MRIAFVSDFSPWQLSGVSDSLCALLPALHARGHEVRLYAPVFHEFREDVAGIRPFLRVIPSFGLPWMPGYRVIFPVGLHKDLRAFHPDVLHVQTLGIAGLAALRHARRLQIPLVGTNHVYHPQQYLPYFGLPSAFVNRLLYRYFAWFYRHCRILTAPSQAVFEDFRNYHLPPERVVLSNPVDTVTFRPLPDRGRCKSALGVGEHVVLFFGRIAQEKKLGETLHAFATVLAAEPRAELLMVGDGPGKRATEEEAKRLGVAPRVTFTGSLRGGALVDAINAGDVFLITSPAESQSLTTLQAMACGVPVVGVRGGALPEYVREGETGFLVSPGDTDAMAARILALFKDGELRRAMGERGRVSVEQFSPAAIAERWEGVYEKAMRMESAESAMEAGRQA